MRTWGKKDAERVRKSAVRSKYTRRMRKREENNERIKGPKEMRVMVMSFEENHANFHNVKEMKIKAFEGPSSLPLPFAGMYAHPA